MYCNMLIQKQCLKLKSYLHPFALLKCLPHGGVLHKFCTAHEFMYVLDSNCAYSHFKFYIGAKRMNRRNKISL